MGTLTSIIFAVTPSSSATNEAPANVAVHQQEMSDAAHQLTLLNQSQADQKNPTNIRNDNGDDEANKKRPAEESTDYNAA